MVVKGETRRVILGLSGDAETVIGFLIFKDEHISSCNFFVAVAVRAMILTVAGKILRTSPSLAYSLLNSSPL